MHKGVSVWLDVPVEALAQRIAAVGTNSRPLLNYEAGDPYTRVIIYVFFYASFISNSLRADLVLIFLHSRGC